MKTDMYTIFCLLNKNNKFSNNGNITLYFYDKYKVEKYKETDILPIDLNKLKTYKENDKLIIEYLNNYKQEIDFNENKMKIYI